MAKEFTGTKFLLYLAFFQVLSMKALVNSQGVHQFFSWVVLIYVLLLWSLLAVHLVLGLRGKVKMQNQTHKGSPKLFTISNIGVALILACVVYAAKSMNYLYLTHLAVASLLGVTTVLLYLTNRFQWNKQNPTS